MSDAAHVLPNRPTDERMARGRLIEVSAIGTDDSPAQAGARMYRAVSTIERMHKDGALSDRQRDAAGQLRDDYELASGARDHVGGIGTRFGWYFSDAQIAATERYARATIVLGRRLTEILVPLVIGRIGGGDITLTDMSQQLRRNRQEIAGILKLGLDLLADHYGLA